MVGIEEEWIEPDDGWDAPSPAGPADVLGVLYTSGTTSRPKGVLVTHAAYLHCGDVVAGHLRLRPDDRQLVVLPLFHGNAQYYSTMSEQAATLDATVASPFAAPIRMILAAAPGAHDTAHRLRVALFAQNVSDAQHVGVRAPLRRAAGSSTG